MGNPISDSAALHEIAAHVLPGSGDLTVQRTATGGSTPVYRIRRGRTTLYLRLAESSEASLAPEMVVHNELRARGVRVPDVVSFDPFNQALQRSVMVTTEILGAPLGRNQSGIDIGAVLIEAGRDLAIINQISVEGFGWIRRDRPHAHRLEAELPTLAAFALDDLEAHLSSLEACLTSSEIEEIRTVITQCDPWLDADHAVLAHGDFDATHTYHLDGQYTGIIDFGEIRGTDPFYDLGHFGLHDGEVVPFPLLPHLLKGYGEVVSLPGNHMPRIHLWSLLIGVRSLARSINRPRSPYQDYLAGAIRRALGMFELEANEGRDA